MEIEKVKSFLLAEKSSAPLVVFRFAFGMMMFLSIVRFAAKGWIDALYIQPTYFFTFYGFECVKPLSPEGMYLAFSAMALSAVLVAFGIWYRISIISFFLLFTYVELIDKTNYLNHYYFISLLSFLMCFLPDVGSVFNKRQKSKLIPTWSILTLQFQLAIVYFFAGMAKINSDWLLEAMPLKIWLSSKTDLPVIGFLLGKSWVAFLFSWCGMLFDVSIAFFLFNRRTVWYAYAVVLVFHLLTAILFPGIGMFPFIMMVCASIFLPSSFYEKITNRIENSQFLNSTSDIGHPTYSSIFNTHFLIAPILTVFFLIQILLPLRSHLYSDNLFYHEQGYRFSWRVMLMEKAGLVFFRVKNADGSFVEVNNRKFLTTQQEKQMSTQPDMILQFAHFLEKEYKTSEVYAEAYVTVNGRGSRLFIDPRQNLCGIQDDFENKNWVLAAQ